MKHEKITKEEKQAIEESIESWLASLPYDEYLQQPYWYEQRKRVYKRAGYRCQICNEAKPLEVHHRCYRNRGKFDLELADCIAVCPDCHGGIHERVKIYW